MKTLLTSFFLIICLLSFAQQKQVCFSIDDMPVVSYGNTDSIYQTELLSKIISSLKENKVPAIGFVNEKKMHNNDGILQYQVNLLRIWLSAGLALGNHTYSHPDYNKVSFQFYTEDVIKGEPVLRQILKEQNKTLKYFRHPYLHVGNTKARADSLDEFLKNNSYVVAPVTIDNEDYLFASAYARTQKKNDTALMHRIGKDYINYMEAKIRFYEMASNNLFGRNISQILLIHASALNSDYLNELIGLFRNHDYAFVSMDTALKDPVYKTEITVYGNWGISWIDKWALTAGKKKDFFKDDPATPDYIVKLAE